MNYKFHMQRTAMSINTSLKNAATERSEPFDNSQYTQLEAELDKTLRHDLAELLSTCLSMLHGDEYRLTVYIACLSPLRCEYHAELLPKSAVSPVAASLWPSNGRTTPQVKTSSWLTSAERARMSASVRGRINDAVMFSENGDLLEGISSNAFAIINGKVYTAPLSKVLKGTMRTTIAEACERIGIPFIEESPNVAAMETWESFFISSSSRLALEIDSVEVYSREGVLKERKLVHNGGKTFQILSDEIHKIVTENSIQILP